MLAEHNYAYSTGTKRADVLSMVSLFSRDNMDQSLYTQVRCGLKMLTNLPDEADLQPECQVAPRGCWIPGQHFLSPGSVFCIIGHRVCNRRSLSDLFSVEWELSSLESTYMVYVICLCGSAGVMTLCSWAGFWLILQFGITFLGFNCKGRKGDEGGRGYCMISFIFVLVLTGDSFHIQ